eukprot:jgi/Tetstr1/422441/TSEL_013279.t1
MGFLQTLRSAALYIKGNEKARDLIIYVIFLSLFSLVTFASKPGEVQFFLNDFHGRSMSVGLSAVASTEGMYAWLDSTLADKLYPLRDPSTGDYLNALDRMYISGDFARSIGAVRVRQVRSKSRKCVVPSFLQQVQGQDTVCARDYSTLARQRTNIFPEGSAGLARVTAANMSEPFTYRKAGQINSTALFGQSGTFGTYGQDGFALDTVPNVAPNVFAAYVSWCRPVMIKSINACREAQGLDPVLPGSVLSTAPADDAADVPTPTPTATADAANPVGRRLLQAGAAPPPPPPPVTGASCSEDNELAPYLAGMDVGQCSLLYDETHACQLRYVSFADMLDLMSPASENNKAALACGGCKCRGDRDSTCVETCSPKKLFRRQVAALRTQGWIDEDNTRAVMVDVGMFNQNFNLFTTFRAFFEVPTIGGVRPRSFTSTFRIHRYVSHWDRVVMGLEVVFCIFIFFFTVQELREIVKLKAAYFKDPWNLMDWANLIILYVVIGLRVGSLLMAEGFSFSSSSIRYVDLVPMGAFATQELNVSALNFFLLYFKVFKYLRDVPRMDAILVTISGALVDLFLFIIMAAIVLIGFSAAFYVCFGMDVAEYRSMGNSFGSLIQALLGVFNYGALRDANSIMAPILFYLYFAVVFFILLSMFIAILDDSYGQAKENQTEEDLNYYVNLGRKFMMSINGMLGRKQAVHSLARDLLNADDGETLDGLLDEAELEAVLKKHPRAKELLRSTGVKELMEKYDTNADGVLDRGELLQLIDRLMKDQAAVEQGVKDAQKGPGGEGGRGGLPEGMMELQADILGVENKVTVVDGQLKDLSRNVAKKLSLMIDLMMSLSDQVATTGQVLPGQLPPTTTVDRGYDGTGGSMIRM